MDGVRRALPIVLGYVPVAFAFGVLAVKSNIPPALVVAMSVFHFAGSGQFVCAGLWGAGVGAMSVIVAVFVVNLRHLLMSAAMAEPLAPLKRWQRFLFGCEMTDETFGVHITAFQRGWKLCTATLFTCNLTAHASWVLGTVIGVFCGGLVHDVKPLGLDYALTAMFLALLVPQCVSRLHVLVAIVTAILSLTDSIEYGQLKNGKRNEAVTLSVRPMLDKIAGACSNGIVGAVAIAAGMIGNATAADMTAANIRIFEICAFYVPLAVIILSAVVFLLKVKITEKMHDGIVRQLEAQLNEG